MKIKRKVITSTIFIASLFALNLSKANPTSADQVDNYNADEQAVNIKYEEIYDDYNRMINSFAYDCVFYNKTRSLDQNEQISEIAIDYPDNYAGACYNANDDGKLDIYLTNKEKEDYIAFFEDDEINIHLVDFSLDELIEAQNKISPYMSKYNIEGIGLYQKDNVLKISYNEEFSESYFKELLVDLAINEQMIEFEGNESIVDTAATVPSGSRIDISQYGTVGFNAYRSQTKQYGIVTAGHLLKDVSNSTTIRDSSNRVINTRGSSIVYNNANDVVDCAFVPFNGSYGWRTTTNYNNSGYTGNIIGSNYVHSTLEGTQVVKYGATTGKETGTILSTSYNGNMGGLYKYDYILCSNHNEGGDSGGPIGIESNGDLTLVALTCNRNNNYETFGCKITNVIGRLGVNISYK